MYKHHSYNNLIESKLEQLPPPDADHLWSNMEAMLDQQLPPQKRKPRFLAWLLARKVVMLVALSVVAGAGATLLYFSGNASLGPQHAAALTHTAKNNPAISAATPAAVAAPGQTTASARQTAAAGPAAAPAASLPAGISTHNMTQLAGATAPATASINKPSASIPHKTNPSQATANSSVSAPAAANGQTNASTTQDASDDLDRIAALPLAATTREVTTGERPTPSVDAGAVKIDNTTLEQLSQHIASATAVAAKKAAKPADEHGFYAALMTGVDLSSVKFASMQTGNNNGLIVGYAFNRFWSIESGLLWDKKRYAAPGANYQPDGYTPQAGLTIMDVRGTNQLYELPLSVRYNFLARQNKLFVTAGVSSYFMKKETYDLHYTYNGQVGEQYDTYANASQHWFSVASFSLGYTYKLGNVGSLRVEPYVKLPLRDLGVGNMRVTSTGLNVGLTRTLKR